MQYDRPVSEHLGRTFARYVSLNVLSMLGLSLYILADTYFIANSVGSEGIVALNIVLPAYSLIDGLGLMLGIGGATRFSIAHGEGRPEKGSFIFSKNVSDWLKPGNSVYPGGNPRARGCVQAARSFYGYPSPRVGVSADDARFFSGLFAKQHPDCLCQK